MDIEHDKRSLPAQLVIEGFEANGHLTRKHATQLFDKMIALTGEEPSIEAAAALVVVSEKRGVPYIKALWAKTFGALPYPEQFDEPPSDGLGPDDFLDIPGNF